MGSIPRLRKFCTPQPLNFSFFTLQPTHLKRKEGQIAFLRSLLLERETKRREKNEVPRKIPRKIWRCMCMNDCLWAIGFMCTVWWFIVFVYHCLPSNLVGLHLPESPGQRLRREGLNALHPVVLVPGIVTGGLELWEGRPCSQGLFRKRLWGGGSFAEIFKRPMCWLEHLSLNNETGLDPPGIRVRPVSGLVAADYFAPGYFVWAVLIENLAKIGYEEKNLHMAAYDWRLSFQNTEVRDYALSRLKSKIELMYMTNGNKKVVVVPHSMGAIYFLHFLKWVESPPPTGGGGGGPGWCAKYIKAIMNIAPAFLGVPRTLANILSAEDKGISFLRAMAPGVFDSEILRLQTLEHAMRVSRTWDSIISLFPKGGETIWGNLDWSPEKDQECDFIKKRVFRSCPSDGRTDNTTKNAILLKEDVNYGRIISFGKTASELHSSQLPSLGFKDFAPYNTRANSNMCRDLLTEYDELSREIIGEVAKHKAYTAGTVLDLVRFVAPKMMQRAEAHFSHGIADDLDDPKYTHYKYWSNPLETRQVYQYQLQSSYTPLCSLKLPNAPDMEIYCLYGVGVPTDRAYIYKLSSLDRCRSIPYRIDSSANARNPGGCLKGGIYFSDGDASVPIISAGFMCARGWRGKTRFNPSGAPTYVREYGHKAPSSLLDGRGSESGAHVGIMGNVALIEDVLRVAAGATREELGGDRIFSDIMSMSRAIRLRV
ncbi:hypothetical protein Cgig2_007828 [Carnegiea gigantea]|uniref:Phospholipid:diacylglycerol acyltransferase 2 n=1 Tax=Carnegiea gigantea TaxID=171969 RepID=A0A9Q1JNJ8_9CARY|nr:hypothetical protein Cgig2_007828 [Carnegiea gigantea]